MRVFMVVRMGMFVAVLPVMGVRQIMLHLLITGLFLGTATATIAHSRLLAVFVFMNTYYVLEKSASVQITSKELVAELAIGYVKGNVENEMVKVRGASQFKRMP